jgi:hypothetical protein
MFYEIVAFCLISHSVPASGRASKRLSIDFLYLKKVIFEK